MPRQLWIAQVLRDAGLTVREAPGWEERGTTTFDPIGVMWHHTASGRNWTDQALTNLLVNGRPDLRGPLCHLQLNRDGSYVVIAAGRANHAGTGKWNDITTGNTSFIGIEAANDGVREPWPKVQLDAYYRGTLAILKHINGSVDNVIGHKEWTTRKIDPNGIDMTEVRSTLNRMMNPSLPNLPAGLDWGSGGLPSVPQRPVLRRGARGDDVVFLQKRLSHHGFSVGNVDGIFGVITEQSVRRFQQDKRLSVDGIVGRITWGELDKPARPVAVSAPAINIPSSCTSNLFRRGSRGRCVGVIQRRLNTLGLSSGTPDNVFGPKTEQAVKNFQTQRKLLADGVVGPKTWSELKK